MSLLPEIEDGKLIVSQTPVKLSFSKRNLRQKSRSEINMIKLNNFGHKVVAEDFSDSPYADKN